MKFLIAFTISELNRKNLLPTVGEFFIASKSKSTPFMTTTWPLSSINLGISLARSSTRSGHLRAILTPAKAAFFLIYDSEWPISLQTSLHKSLHISAVATLAIEVMLIPAIILLDEFMSICIMFVTIISTSSCSFISWTKPRYPTRFSV